MQKRGQAAVEFLTTYGWAFVVVLLMISALSYWGILNPREALPERCTFPSEFICMNHQADTDASTFRMRLRNNVGDSIAASFDEGSLTNEQGLTCATAPDPITSWPQSETIDLTWSGCTFAANAVVSGEKAKVAVNFTYYDVKSGAQYSKRAKGDIITDAV